MSKLSDFVNANRNKPLDYDLHFGDQCVDLVQFWAQALGTKRFYGNAIDIINQPGTDYIRVDNSPTNFPSPGDIVVWRKFGKFTGEYGHVDLCIDANVNTYTGFDQNWYGHQYCEVLTHDYVDVVGWLHPKVLDKPSTPTNQGVDMINADQVKDLYRLLLGREASQAEADDWATNPGGFPVVFYAIKSSPEGAAYAERIAAAAGLQAVVDKAQATITDLTKKLKDAGELSAKEAQAVTDLQGQLAAAQNNAPTSSADNLIVQLISWFKGLLNKGGK